MDDKIQVGNGSDFDIEVTPGPNQRTRVLVNKDTHRIYYDGENEHEVTLCVEPKPKARYDCSS